MPTRNRIIFVPGKNPKPLPAEHRALLWRCLIGGIQKVDADLVPLLVAEEGCFQLAAWNGIYYRQIKAVEEDIPWIEAMLAKAGADPRDRREALSWRRRWAWLLYTLADMFPFLIALVPDPAVKSTIRETERYFSNRDGVADQVRELLKAPLRQMLAQGDRILLISHSMGTVIAYDALWELWNEEQNPASVDLMLTLGSPLGMRFVQDRLVGFRNGVSRRFPGNIRRWINVAAQGDLTALDRELRNDFAPMVERGLTQSIDDVHDDVYTHFRNRDGLNVHRSYGYLVNDRVAQVIAAWWRAGQ